MKIDFENTRLTIEQIQIALKVLCDLSHTSKTVADFKISLHMVTKCMVQPPGLEGMPRFLTQSALERLKKHVDKEFNDRNKD